MRSTLKFTPDRWGGGGGGGGDTVQDHSGIYQPLINSHHYIVCNSKCNISFPSNCHEDIAL